MLTKSLSGNADADADGNGASFTQLRESLQLSLRTIDSLVAENRNLRRLVNSFINESVEIVPMIHAVSKEL